MDGKRKKSSSPSKRRSNRPPPKRKNRTPSKQRRDDHVPDFLDPTLFVTQTVAENIKKTEPFYHYQHIDKHHTHKKDDFSQRSQLNDLSIFKLYNIRDINIPFYIVAIPKAGTIEGIKRFLSNVLQGGNIDIHNENGNMLDPSLPVATLTDNVLFYQFTEHFTI